MSLISTSKTIVGKQLCKQIAIEAAIVFQPMNLRVSSKNQQLKNLKSDFVKHVEGRTTGKFFFMLDSFTGGILRL